MRPHVVLSCAVSLDGYLDDTSPSRLILSGPEDLDRVDALRASCDAILVGAGTVRADNPRLRVRSADRRAARVAAGRPATPLRVTMTASGDLDPSAALFSSGPPPLVYTSAATRDALHTRLGAAATVAVAEDVAALLADLSARGVHRLLVEGGAAVLTAMLAGGLADELQVAVAPLVLGARGASRFVDPAGLPDGRSGRMRLCGVEAVGDVAVLHYAGLGS